MKMCLVAPFVAFDLSTLFPPSIKSTGRATNPNSQPNVHKVRKGHFSISINYAAAPGNVTLAEGPPVEFFEQLKDCLRLF